MSVEVSIIIPCFNAEQYIGRCIDSVLSQSYDDFEILAVDDASSDSTVACLHTYDDERLHIIKLEENSGSPAEPRNVGIRRAKGSYIAFLDCDDIWHPEKLKNQVLFMKENMYQFSCTNYIVRECDGNEYGRNASALANFYDLLVCNTVGCSTVLISKNLISRFEFRNRPHEDFDMWLQILREENSVYGLNEYLTTYTKRKNSRSRLSLLNFIGYHSLFKSHGKVGNFRACIMMFQYLRGNRKAYPF